MLAQGLTRTLERSNIPIYGVSIGNESDRTTWRIDFKSTATATHRSQAATILANYNVETDTITLNEINDNEFNRNRAIAALARATWEQLPTITRPTFTIFLDRVKILYRG